MFLWLAPSCHTHMLAQTVASVGPYALTSLLPAAQRFIVSSSHTSPAATSVFSVGNFLCGSTDSRAGGSVAVVMPRLSISSISLSGSLFTSSGSRCSSAPDSSAVKISDTDASKLSGANWRTRLELSI